MLDDAARTAVVVGVLIAVLGPLLWMLLKVLGRGVRKVWDRLVIPYVLAPVGRQIGAGLRGYMVDAVDEEMAGTIARSITAAVGMLDQRIDAKLDARYGIIDGRLKVIEQELTTNGGSSLKDRVNATATRVESIDRRLHLSEMEQAAVWETLAEHGIDRRRSEADQVTTEIMIDQPADSDGADGSV